MSEDYKAKAKDLDCPINALGNEHLSPPPLIPPSRGRKLTKIKDEIPEPVLNLIQYLGPK